MTIVTKPLASKKIDSSKHPLVGKHQQDAQALPLKTDVEARVEPEARYLVLRARARRISMVTSICLFLTVFLLTSIGIMSGLYMYRRFNRSQMHFRGWCNIPSSSDRPGMGDIPQGDSSAMSNTELLKSLGLTDTKMGGDSPVLRYDPAAYFREDFELDLETEFYEKIDVPSAKDMRRGRFIHDFTMNKTGIVDLDTKTCFVMPLNRKYVLPPRSLHELIEKMWDGYYEIDTRTIEHTMRIQLPPLEDKSADALGVFISKECQDFPTFMLEPVRIHVFRRSITSRADRLGEWKFAEFAGNSIMKLGITNPGDLSGFLNKAE